MVENLISNTLSKEYKHLFFTNSSFPTFYRKTSLHIYFFYTVLYLEQKMPLFLKKKINKKALHQYLIDCYMQNTDFIYI